MQSKLWENGRFVGGFVGAILRALVMCVNFHWYGGNFLALMCLVSAVLGGLCGAVTAGSHTVLRGALWGGVVSGLSFAMFVFPIAFVASFFGAAGSVERFSMPYLLERAAVGAIAGAIGAFVKQHNRPMVAVAAPL